MQFSVLPEAPCFIRYTILTITTITIHDKNSNLVYLFQLFKKILLADTVLNICLPKIVSILFRDTWPIQ